MRLHCLLLLLLLPLILQRPCPDCPGGYCPLPAWGSPYAPVPPAPVPPALPARPVMDGNYLPPTGVVASEIKPKDGSRIKIVAGDGSPLTMADAIGRVSIPDFSKHRRVTCIGTKAECDAFRQRLGDVPGVVFKTYQPGDWALTDLRTGKSLGFREDGHPSVYVQDPDGKVTMDAHGIAAADRLIAALRQRDPNFDPNKTPGLGDSPLDWLARLNWQMIGVVTSVVLFLLGLFTQTPQPPGAA